MTLPTELFDDVIVLHAPEEVGAEQSEPFTACVASLDKPNVVFDLDAVESIDSNGLTALLDAQDALRDRGGEAKLAVSNPTNRKILEITRLDQQLEMFESVVDAVRSFR